MHVGIGTLAILALGCLSGCRGDGGGTDVQSAAPECSDAGQRQADALAESLGAPSATATVIDLCLTKWDTPPFFGHLKGIQIDPFLKGGTLRQAERTLARRFDCEEPVAATNFKPNGVASIDCTIGNVSAEVNLQRDDRFFSSKPERDPEQRRVIAYIYPRT